MPLVLGLDCGGSKARAMVQDDLGQIVFDQIGGPANLAATNPDLLMQSLRDAVAGCPDVKAVAGCFAGLLTDQDRQRAESALREIFPSATTLAWPDYAAALAAADTDAVLICGTGSVMAWWEGTEIRKSGGLGPLIGDDLSMFAIGRAVLRYAFLEQTRLALPDVLSEFFQSEYGSTDRDAVVAAIYRSGAPAAKIARATIPAVQIWESSDHELGEVVDGMLRQIAAAIATLNPGTSIALTGGFWNLSRQLFDGLNQAAEAMSLNLITQKQVRIDLLVVEPVVGAVRLARRLLSS